MLAITLREISGACAALFVVFCLDRAYRIGQTKEVFVYLPILCDPSGQVAPSFDERLDTLLAQKSRDAEDFLCPLPGEDSLGSELFEGLSN
jgi:hypothetical protein